MKKDKKKRFEESFAEVFKTSAAGQLTKDELARIKARYDPESLEARLQRVKHNTKKEE